MNSMEGATVIDSNVFTNPKDGSEKIHTTIEPMNSLRKPDDTFTMTDKSLVTDINTSLIKQEPEVSPFPDSSTPIKQEAGQDNINRDNTLESHVSDEESQDSFIKQEPESDADDVNSIENDDSIIGELDEYSPTTVPDGLCIIESSNDSTDDIKGIWSTILLPKGTQFGPFPLISNSPQSVSAAWISMIRETTGENEECNIKIIWSCDQISCQTLLDIQPGAELLQNETENVTSPPETETSSTNAESYPDWFKNILKSTQSDDNPATIKSREKRHKCPECGKLFARLYYLRNHILAHSGKKAYTCKDCGQSFTWSTNLYVHRRTHTGRMRHHECDECGKVFVQPYNLKKHKRKHTGIRPFVCDCGKSFVDKSDLHKHQTTHSDDKPYQCPDCGKGFRHAYGLQTHVVMHTGEKPYVCEICNHRFTQNSNLRSHMKIHSGLTPYKCEFCNKEFSQAGQLSSHLLVHTKIKDHKCDVCSKKFSRPSDLKKHLRIHSGEKPYSCPICGRNFSQIGSMKTHQSTHAGNKKLQCEDCGQKFVRVCDLTKHIRKHPADKPHKCPDCGKGFSKSSYMYIHRQSHLEDLGNSNDSPVPKYAI